MKKFTWFKAATVACAIFGLFLFFSSTANAQSISLSCNGEKIGDPRTSTLNNTPVCDSDTGGVVKAHRDDLITMYASGFPAHNPDSEYAWPLMSYLIKDGKFYKRASMFMPLDLGNGSIMGNVIIGAIALPGRYELVFMVNRRCARPFGYDCSGKEKTPDFAPPGYSQHPNGGRYYFASAPIDILEGNHSKPVPKPTPPPAPKPTPIACQSIVDPFGWNCAGPISGMMCTQIIEAADPHTWNDNYFCATSDIGMRWSSAGPISGMTCTKTYELSDPNTWNDNYLCLPSGSPYTFSWSPAGPIGGLSNIQWSEPSDPDTWHDNYLAWTYASPPTVNNPIGYHDNSDCTASGGWTCDADDYNRSLDVHFYEGSTFLGAVTANIPAEPGVAAACGGKASHRFSFLTPAFLKDGNSHAITAYGINIGGGNNVPLETSPHTIACVAPPPLPSGGNCDTAFPENKFHVCFFDGIGAPTSASPTLIQRDEMFFPSPVGGSQGIKKDWGTGIVEGTGKSDKVSAVWRGRLNFKEGTFNFHTKSDDGIELKLDGATVISNWNDHPPIQNDLNSISGGLVRDVQLRWYENDGGASVEFWWDWTPKPESKPEPKPEPRPEPSKPLMLGIQPTKAKPGETVTIISWPGFSNNTRVNVYFDDTRLKSVFLSSDLPQIVIPTTATNGKHTIKITNFDGLGDTLSAPIEIYGSKDKIEQTLTVDPQTVLAGDSITIKGAGWSQGEKTFLLVTLDEKKFNLDNLEDRCPLSTGRRVCEEGDIFYSAKIPAGLTAGAYYLMAFGNGGKERASFEIKVLAPQKLTSDSPKIVLNPVSGRANMAIAVMGAGFSKKSGLLAKFDLEKLELGKGSGLVTDERGSFSTIIYIPAGAKPGKHTVSFSTGIGAGVATQVISGSYRCMRTSGSGTCRSLPPIFLKADGTYSIGLEKGTYTIAENKISLSESKIRGAGVFNQDYIQINFEYEYNQKPQQIVYLWEDLKSPPVLKQKEQKAREYAEAEFTVLDNDAGTGVKAGETKTEDKNKAGESPTRQDQETKKYGDETTKTFGDIETKTYGDVKTNQYGDVPTKTYGGVETKTYGDVKTNTYGDVKTKTYGGVEIKTYGDVETKKYGDTPTKSYGGVETKTYGDVPTKTYGGVETKTFGDIETKTYGDVKAPTYEAPKVEPGACNPSIPTFSQPGCTKPSSLNNQSYFFAGFFDFVKNVFKRKPKQETRPKPAQEFMQFVPPSPVGSRPLEIKEEKPTDTKSSQPAKESLQKIQKVEVKEIPKAPVPKISSKSSQKISGSYRCWQYNVSGGGGSCRISPPLVLKSDGTYSMSSEEGTYYIEGDQIVLSESKIRGPGKFLEGNMQIRFEYDYNSWHHTITYLRENINIESQPEKPLAPAAKYVEITLRIIYPQSDYSADSVNTVTLYSKDGGEQVAQSLAYALDRSTTEVWFSKRSPKIGLLTGRIYKVMVSSGFGEWQVGELDLRNVNADTTITINASPQ